jgi:ankyrin repeat protein
MNRVWHMKELIGVGANVNARNKYVALYSSFTNNAFNREGRTPLCYANSEEEVVMLLEKGADAKVIDKNGWSVIMNFIANKSRLPNRTLIGSL